MNEIKLEPHFDLWSPLRSLISQRFDGSSFLTSYLYEISFQSNFSIEKFIFFHGQFRFDEKPAQFCIGFFYLKWVFLPHESCDCGANGTGIWLCHKCSVINLSGIVYNCYSICKRKWMKSKHFVVRVQSKCIFAACVMQMKTSQPM